MKSWKPLFAATTLITILILIGSLSAKAQDPTELAKIQSSVNDAVQSEENEFKANIARLREFYIKSLERLLEFQISNGEPKAALEFKNEIEFVKGGGEISIPINPENLSQRIIEMRQKFQVAGKAHLDTRNANVRAIQQQGVKLLKLHARELTKTGNLDQVEKVQLQIAEWVQNTGETAFGIVIAKIVAEDGGELKGYRKGQQLFSDKPVNLREIPDEFRGLSFVYSNKDRSVAKVTVPGLVYVVTAAPETPNDRSGDLKNAGFKKAAIKSFQLYDDHEWEKAAVYEKSLNVGEIISFNKYGIIVARE